MVPLEFVLNWVPSVVWIYVCTHYTARALDRMAYINIIILSNPAVVRSLFLSHYTFTSFSCCATSPLSFQQFTIFSGEQGEDGEMWKEMGKRYKEQRVMNLTAACNTLRFIGSSLVSDPNLMRQDSFSLSPPTQARTHLLPPPFPAVAGVVHHPSIFSCLSLSYNPWKLPWSIKDWAVVLEGKHTPTPTNTILPPAPSAPAYHLQVCVCVCEQQIVTNFKSFAITGANIPLITEVKWRER